MKIQQKCAERLYELLPHKKGLESHYFKGNNLRCSNCGATAQQEYDGVPCNKVIEFPIRLADLLMAIEKVLNDNHICYVNSVGAVYILDMNKSYQKQFEDTNYGEYNLSKDNILDQSDEFCEFVLELLK